MIDETTKMTENLKKYTILDERGHVLRSDIEPSRVYKKVSKGDELQLYQEEFIRITQKHNCLCSLYCLQWSEKDNINYISMEYLNGLDLFDLLCKKDNLADPVPIYTNGGENGKEKMMLSFLSNQRVKKILYQVLLALEYLNLNGYVHCDVKSENVRYLRNGNIKLFDYNLAEKIENDPKKVKGTIGYISPEMLHNGCNSYYSHYDERTDIWSLGCMIYYLMEGKTLFSYQEHIYYKQLQKFDVRWIHLSDQRWDTQLKEIFQDLMNLCGIRRLNAQQLLEKYGRTRSHQMPTPYLNFKSPELLADEIEMTNEIESDTELDPLIRDLTRFRCSV